MRFTQKFPNILLFLGQLPELIAQKAEEEIIYMIKQINNMIEVFLYDEAIFEELDYINKQEAKVWLEFVKTNQKILENTSRVTPLSIKNIENDHLKYVVSNFLTLKKMYFDKNTKILQILENICEDATDFLRKNHSNYEQLIEATKRNPSKTFEKFPFE